MATNIQGPGIYLAQFASDTAPFDSWASITKWAGGLGFKGVQIPSWDKRIFDMDKAAESQTYCDEIAGAVLQAVIHVAGLAVRIVWPRQIVCTERFREFRIERGSSAAVADGGEGDHQGRLSGWGK